jgi:acetolactate synthase I/II/III large subunit
MKGYEYIAQLLNEYGTTHLFFQEVCLRYAGKEAEDKFGIKGIMGHCEKAVGYMADGYARASGKVGVCAAQSIGAANLAAGIGDAALAKTPMVAITGKKPPLMQNRQSYQELDHTKQFEAYVKYQADITTPEQMSNVLKQAFREAATGKPGPVHVDMMGLQCNLAEQFELDEKLIFDPKFGKLNPFRPMADESRIQEAAKLIGEAQKPIIVSGRGANMSRAGEAIYKLAVKADIPIATTPDGKTTLDEKDDLWAGIVGDYGMQCANKSVKSADLVIFIGTQTSDQTTCKWNVPNMDTKVIQIDIAPMEIGRNYTNCVGLCGDAKAVAIQLFDAAIEKRNPKWREEVLENLADTVILQNEKINKPSNAIRSEKLCHELAKALPDDAILIADTGNSAIWTSTYVRMRTSQKYFRAAGSLGWAYPASIGAKCGAPDRPVICFIGDGGLYYNLSEMETAVRYNIPTVTVVNNNNVYAQCMPSIVKLYNDKPEDGAKKLTFASLDISKIAESFGLFAIRVTKAEEIGTAIQKAIQSGRPALVEVITESSGDISPMPALI